MQICYNTLGQKYGRAENSTLFKYKMEAWLCWSWAPVKKPFCLFWAPLGSSGFFWAPLASWQSSVLRSKFSVSPLLEAGRNFCHGLLIENASTERRGWWWIFLVLIPISAPPVCPVFSGLTVECSHLYRSMWLCGTPTDNPGCSSSVLSEVEPSRGPRNYKWEPVATPGM